MAVVGSPREPLSERKCSDSIKKFEVFSCERKINLICAAPDGYIRRNERNSQGDRVQADARKKQVFQKRRVGCHCRGQPVRSRVRWYLRHFLVPNP